ncbi:serine protease [Microcoleus vaginatus DQ-U2]|uniref:S1 family peptidase n=2 Tax=Microcoleus TaxID=44471 RepID=UPI001685899F|nr:trypsin-like peptidase domain-containing protein [Microcoleus sp. FACHB-DQ6]
MVTDDGFLHPLLRVPRRLGNSDLAIVLFRSASEYKIALFSLEPGAVSEPVLAVGFPAGAEVGALAVTRASFRCCYPNLCLKVILGYTNEVKIGMSGGPIFNAKGFLLGINGRGKYRDPTFGVYAFEDGSEPTAELLEQDLSAK